MDEQRLIHARTELERARARLGASLDARPQRLKPEMIVDRVSDDVKSRVGKGMGEAEAFVANRPAASGAIASAALLLLFRKPIGRLIGKATRRGDAALDDDNTGDT